jgi:hypothetical protein
MAQRRAEYRGGVVVSLLPRAAGENRRAWHPCRRRVAAVVQRFCKPKKLHLFAGPETR